MSFIYGYFDRGSEIYYGINYLIYTYHKTLYDVVSEILMLFRLG